MCLLTVGCKCLILFWYSWSQSYSFESTFHNFSYSYRYVSERFSFKFGFFCLLSLITGNLFYSYCKNIQYGIPHVQCVLSIKTFNGDKDFSMWLCFLYSTRQLFWCEFIYFSSLFSFITPFIWYRAAYDLLILVLTFLHKV